MNFRDTIERLFWTLIAAFLGALTVSDLLDITAVQAGITAAASAGANFILLVARARLAVLPDPGEGLPLLPADDEGSTDLWPLVSLLVLVLVGAILALVLYRLLTHAPVGL